MPVFLTPEDLAPFAVIAEDKAEAMIADATAQAVIVAPCLKEATDAVVLAAVKAVLRAAVLRWQEAGSGALVTKQRTAGPFSEQDTYDNRPRRAGLFWPDEIETLQGLCDSDSRKAFHIDTLPPDVVARLEAWR